MKIRKIINHLKKLDLVLIFIPIFLVSLGLVAIYSSSFYKKDFLNFKKQIFFLIIGLFLMVLISFFDWRILRTNKFLVYSLYFFSLFLLSLLYFFGKTTRGAKIWYKLGIFSFDPIEILKLSLVLVLANYFSQKHIELYNLSHILISGIFILLPSLLIFFQPNLGSVLILLFLWLAILLTSEINLRYFFALFFLVILLFFVSWQFFLKEYQKQRILGFLFPKPEDKFKINWSQNQAKIAIGSGGFWGKGILKGSQSQLGFLPEPQTDFIFASLAEQIGLVGVFLLLISFFILLYKILKICFSKNVNFTKLFGVGFASLIIFQVFVNMGMNLGILPIIGLSLPFVSYGGSSLIFNFIFLGILQSIKIN